MRKITEIEMKTAMEILERLGYDHSEEDVERNEKQGYISFIVGRDGEDHVWYSDESSELCIRVSDKHELTKNEIEEQFL